MDWKYMQILLRDYQDGRTKYKTAFTLSNVVRIFGQTTEFEAIKIILRPIYKELRQAVDQNQEIPGIISDQRFEEIVYLLGELVDVFYWQQKFRKDNDA